MNLKTQFSWDPPSRVWTIELKRLSQMMTFQTLFRWSQYQLLKAAQARVHFENLTWTNFPNERSKFLKLGLHHHQMRNLKIPQELVKISHLENILMILFGLELMMSWCLKKCSRQQLSTSKPLWKFNSKVLRLFSLKFPTFQFSPNFPPQMEGWPTWNFIFCKR